MKSLKRMLPFVRPYRWVVFWLVVTVIIPTAVELIVPRALRYIIDQGITPGKMDAIIRGSAWMLVTAVVGAIATLVQGFVRATLSQGLAYDMRNRLFTHIQAFSFANLDHMQTGQLMTRLSSDVEMVRGFSSNGLALLLRAILMVLGSLVLMIATDWKLSIIMLVLLPIAALFIRSVIRLAQPLFVVVQETLALLNTMVQENLAGVQVVKAFVREPFEADNFQDHNQDFMQQNIRVGRVMAFTLPVLTLLTNLGIVAVVWFGGLDVSGGRLSLGELIAFNNYLMIGMTPLMMLGNILTMVSRADASAQRFWEVLDMQPAVAVMPTPHRADALQGQVSFDDVSFHYDGEHLPEMNGNAEHRGGRNVIRHVSFAVQPGQRIALLGATGSGKSTLVNLIPRFYDVDRGTIRIDGVDVRDWDPESLRKKMGVVLQQSLLFSGTVRDNIAYGRPDASLDEVIAAAQAAQAHDFIMAMPEGYDSWVEERGANFSGGQKQRMAIARALLVNPNILILDDSTSAVDMETEAKIRAALDQKTDQITTFIVAQRVSSVIMADQIFVLDQGQITARGTHRELLESSPIYREIYQSQMGNGPAVAA